jgi:hypothetical protein
MCVHSSLNQTYWSGIHNGVSSIFSKTCVYIYTMSYARSICLIQWGMYTHVLMIALLAPCCLSGQYARFSDEYTHMFYWKYYLHHCVCQISMSDLMMNVHIHSSLYQIYWSDTYHGVCSAISNTCVYTHR